MVPRVFRGVGFARGASQIAALVIAYAGAFAVLWGLGLVVRGWQGWALLLTPLAAMVGLRLWAWHRVSVEVAGGVVRYEGAVPASDFEIPLEQIAGVYFDRTLRERPLVFAIDGDERICGELSPRAARELRAHLVSLGVPALDREVRA